MRDEGDAGLAPVIPLFASAPSRAESEAWDRTWRSDPVDLRSREHRGASGDGESGRDESEASERAADVLVRRLRIRPLSVREAEAILLKEGASPDAAAAVIARYGELGYLDDAALAAHLVDTLGAAAGRAVVRSPRSCSREASRALSWTPR